MGVLGACVHKSPSAHSLHEKMRASPVQVPVAQISAIEAIDLVLKEVAPEIALSVLMVFPEQELPSITFPQQQITPWEALEQITSQAGLSYWEEQGILFIAPEQKQVFHQQNSKHPIERQMRRSHIGPIQARDVEVESLIEILSRHMGYHDQQHIRDPFASFGPAIAEIAPVEQQISLRLKQVNAWQLLQMICFLGDVDYSFTDIPSLVISTPTVPFEVDPKLLTELEQVRVEPRFSGSVQEIVQEFNEQLKQRQSQVRLVYLPSEITAHRKTQNRWNISIPLGTEEEPMRARAPSLQLRDVSIADALQVLHEIGPEEVWSENNMIFISPERVQVLEGVRFGSEIEETLSNTLIQEIRFQQASVSDVIHYLNFASRELDHQNKGVGILFPDAAERQADENGSSEPAADPFGGAVVQDPSPSSQRIPSITLSLREVSLLDALQVVLKRSGLQYHISKEGEIHIERGDGQP